MEGFGSGRFWWPPDNPRVFYSHQKTPLHWLIDPLCYYVWINPLVSFTFRLTACHMKVLSVAVFEHFPCQVWLLLSFVQLLIFNGEVSPITFYLWFLFFSLSCCYFLLSSVQETDMLYVGRAYASRHTILLGIGTVVLVCCQSKYCSLFTNIMSNGHK